MIGLLLTVFAGIFIYYDGLTIIKNTHRRFKKVNKLVAYNNNRGYLNILYISICMIIEAFYINLLQYLNKSILKQNNKYILTYVINGKVYKMVIVIKKGPSTILLISDENNNDVTNSIIPYFGPNDNWHHSTFTPSFFHKKELTFQLYDGTEKTYNENEIIVFS